MLYCQEEYFHLSSEVSLSLIAYQDFPDYRALSFVSPDITGAIKVIVEENPNCYHSKTVYMTPDTTIIEMVDAFKTFGIRLEPVAILIDVNRDADGAYFFSDCETVLSYLFTNLKNIVKYSIDEFDEE